MTRGRKRVKVGPVLVWSRRKIEIELIYLKQHQFPGN